MDVPSALPVFPLGNVVLLPGGLLPLYIFEPRYCEMVRDILQASRMLGIARLRPGFESDYLGRPPIFDICGVGRVVACEELAEGRYNILLQGVARARIQGEHPPQKAYRVANITTLYDAPVDRATMQTLCENFLTLCHGMAPYLGESGKSLCKMVGESSEPSECLDMVTAALIRDPDTRQTLLETVCPIARAQASSTYVAQLLSQLRGDTDGAN